MKSLPLLRLAVALAGVLSLFGGRFVSAADVLADVKDDAKFLPDRMQLIGVVRVDQLLASPVYKKLKTDISAIGKQEEAIAKNLPVPLDQIKYMILGGGVTGNDDGLFILRARKAFAADDVAWLKDRTDVPMATKVGAYTLYQRRGESFCMPDSGLLIIGRDGVLTEVLKRASRIPEFTSTLQSAIKEAEADPTLSFALDLRSVREHRVGPNPVILGLQKQHEAEEATESLTLSARFTDKIDLSLVALAAKPEDTKLLVKEVGNFAGFFRHIAQRKKEKPNVIETLTLTPKVDSKRVSVASSLTPEVIVRLFKLLDTQRN